MQNLTVRSIDNTFGPFLVDNGHQKFDFTLVFEETIFSILPSALLLLVAPLRIAQLWQTSKKVTPSKLRASKLTLLAVFVATNLANLIVWTLNTTFKTRTSTAAATLSLFAALTLLVLSYLEHARSVRPSFVIDSYLIVTLFLDAAKVRTLLLRSPKSDLAAVSIALLTIKVLILLTEARDKRKLLISPYSTYPPETTSGLYSRSLFWWLNPMFLLGYKSIIRDIDLFNTDQNLLSENLQNSFHQQWSRSVLIFFSALIKLTDSDLGKSPARKYELHLCIARCSLGVFLAGVFPRLCYDGLRFMQPLLIKRVTAFVNQPDNQFSDYQGWGLVGAYGLVYTGIAISSVWFNQCSFRLATMVRGILVTSIYSKTIDLSVTALDENVAVTLMSTDVERVCDALTLIHELYGCTIDIILAVYLLYSEIGLAMLGALAISIGAVAGTFFISARTGNAQKEWLTSIQTRIDITSKTLQSIKGVKMLGLTSVLSNIIHTQRMTEIRQSLSARRLRAWSIIAGNTTDCYAAGVTFSIYVIIAIYNGQLLNVGSAFTALSLISLLAMPIGVLAFTIPQMMAAVACLERIQEYLLLSNRRDHRLTMPHENTTDTKAPKTRVEPHTSDDIELDELTPCAESSIVNSASKQDQFRVVNLSLSWDISKDPVIKDVSFDIKPGVTMLVGPVGSGKSSLLQGLLGEVPSTKGYIYTNALEIAFVGQSPWIQHGSLRDNIIGVSEYDPEFYSTVAYACALVQDFDVLPQGDQTSVGSTGTGLSGGQKLRVALARAVYSRRRTIILDDVFSGLDAGSEEAIFSRLLSKRGLLKNLNTSVLLATHALHRLSYADHILALSADGSLVEQGSFAELMRAEGYISKLSVRHTTETDDAPEAAGKLTNQLTAAEPAQSAAAENLARAVGDLTVYKYYFEASGYLKTALLVVLMASLALFLYFPGLWVNYWANAVAAKGNSVNGRYLGVFLAIETMSWLSLVAVCLHAITIMVPQSARVLHSRLLSAMDCAPLSFFTSTDIGQIVNRFSQDMAVIDNELPFALFEFTASCCMAIVQSVLISLSAGIFAAVMPVVLGIMYLIQKCYLRTSRQIRLMDLEAKAPLYSNFIESLNGLTTIRAFGWTSDFLKHNLTLLDNSQRPFYMLFCIQRWLTLVLDLIVAALATLLMILVVTLRVKLDPGLVGLAFLSIMNFNISLTSIIRNWTSLETSMGAIARIKTFVQETKSEHLPQETAIVPEDWPSKGSITLNNVSASYTTDSPSVLKNITLSIPAGQKIGIAGRSGSGKSSLITTLVHMLEISSGTITIDDLDLSTIPRETLRQRLNIIPQDSLFITGTIRENLDPFSLSVKSHNNINVDPDAPLLAALEKVNLLHLVTALPLGLSTPLDPETLLSHGQRQLFCLARAIIRKNLSPRSSPSLSQSPTTTSPSSSSSHSNSSSSSSILILDEATASVDPTTDQLMQEIIREEFQGCTIIAVAHRLNTIMDFDRVVVLSDGVVVEDGVPGVLVGREGGFLRGLWESRVEG